MDALQVPADLTPDGSVIEHGILVVAYIDGEGERGYAFQTIGDPWLGETLGLLALTEHTLVAESEE